jgi:hypothetical protein
MPDTTEHTGTEYLEDEIKGQRLGIEQIGNLTSATST